MGGEMKMCVTDLKGKFLVWSIIPPGFPYKCKVYHMFLHAASRNFVFHWLHFYEVKMASEMLLLGQGHQARSHVLSFIPGEVRNKRRSGVLATLPWHHQHLPPGLLMFTEEGLRYSPLTFSKWPSSRKGKAAVSDFLHTQSSALNSWAPREDMSYNVHLLALPLLMGRIAPWALTCALPGQVLKDHHIYFPHVYCMLGTVLFIF